MKIEEDFKIQKLAKNEIEYFRYDEGGILTNGNVYCGEIVKTGVKKIYRVMCTKQLKLFNPLNISSSYNLNAKDKKTGNSLFKLREVNEDVFNFYIKFLQTRQDSFLTTAERKI